MTGPFVLQAMCPNPTCGAGTFVSRDDDSGPLSFDSLEAAFAMKKELENRSTGKGFLATVDRSLMRSDLPEYFECRNCHTIFPCRGSTLFVVRESEGSPSVGSVDL